MTAVKQTRRRFRLRQWCLRFAVVGVVVSTLRLWRRVAWNETDTEREQQPIQDAPIKATSSPSSTSYDDYNHHRLLYIGQFGLGHRMSKLSAAVHLAKETQGLHQVEVSFGHCQAEYKTPEWDIFHLLFGTNMIRLDEVLTAETHGKEREPIHKAIATSPSTSFSHKNKTRNKIVLVRNDVLGYYAGQAYKNSRLALPHALPPEWTDKLETDVGLFRYLMRRFVERHAAKFDKFIRTSLPRNDDYFVVGLHVRAGNGESNHFKRAQRGVDHGIEFIQNLVALIAKAFAKERVRNSSSGNQTKTPVIFLATDTASIIPVMTRIAAEQYNISVVTFLQSRLAQDKGVSYAAWTQGAQCLEGWKASLMDMAILALRADVVVAATRSTFTQIVPLALQFGKDNADQSIALKFCEVASSASSMTCFANRQAWLLRRSTLSHDIVSYSLDDGINTVATHGTVHKVMVHLPDVLNGIRDHQEGIAQIQGFLHDPDSEEYFVYGNRINPKYRSKKYVFAEAWTWANDTRNVL